jgi:hypothetical protein
MKKTFRWVAGFIRANSKELVLEAISVFAGASLALYLSNMQSESQERHATRARLHSVLTELTYNHRAATEIAASVVESGKAKMIGVLPDTAATKAAFQDERIFRMLPPHVCNFMHHYILNGDSVRLIANQYDDYILRRVQDPESLLALVAINKNMRELATQFDADVVVLRDCIAEILGPDYLLSKQEVKKLIALQTKRDQLFLKPEGLAKP